MSLGTLLVCNSSVQSRLIEEMISGEESIALLETVNRAAARQAIESLSPKLIWIELHPELVYGFSLLAELKQAFPNVMFLVSHPDRDGEVIRTAFRLGASDFLDHHSWEEELSASIKRIQSQPKKDYVGRLAAKDKDSPLTTLVFCDADLNKRQAIEKLIKSQRAFVFKETVSLAHALSRSRAIKPDLMWLELAPNPWKGLSLLAELKETFDQTAIVVSYDLPNPELVRQSYRLGAFDFLDAQRWRTDLRAVLAILRPGLKPRPIPYPILVLALAAIIAYLCTHLGH